MLNDFEYDVFISYSRDDGEFATNLYRKLSNYKPPADLGTPARRLRVFQDQSDFQGTDYLKAVSEALRNSAKLLILCSPSSSQSRFVGDEISTFLDIHEARDVVSVLISGQPNDETDDKTHWAFHPTLIDSIPIPLASDYRGFETRRHRIDRDEFENAWFKLLADIYIDYDVDRATLEQREKLRRRRTLRNLAAIACVIILALSSLAIWALISRQTAIERGKIAQSRFLATQASTMSRGFDQSLLLAVQAYETSPTQEAWVSLFSTLQRHNSVERMLFARGSRIDNLVLTNNGSSLVSLDGGKRLSVWRRDSSWAPASIELPSLVKKFAADPSGQIAVVSLRNGELIAYSVQDVPKLIWRVASLESSRSFSSLAATTGKVAHSANDRTLVLYDLLTGERLATRALDDLHITQLQFSTDGKELAVLDQQGTVHTLSAENLKTSGPGQKCPEPGEIVLISPSLTACFSGGFQPDNAVTQFSPTPETKKLDNLRDTVRAVRFSRNSKQIALGFMGGKFAIWDVGRHNMSQRKFMPHSGDVTAIGWAENVNQIAIGDQNGMISIQNTNKISRIVGRSKFGQDGKSVVKVGERIIPISTYDNQVDELKDRIEFEKLTSRAPSAFSGNRNVFAAVGGDRLSIWATKDGQRIAALEVPKLHSAGGGLAQLAADATGLRYALIVEALTFRIVDCTSSQDCGSPQSKDRELKTGSYIASIAISADGNLLAVGSGIYDEAIYLWRWTDTEPFAALRGGHDVLDVKSLVFHPTAPILVSSGNRRIVFWDLLGQREIGSIDNLRDDVFRLSFSVDGSVLIAELSNQQAILVEFDSMNWIKLACNVVGRRLDEQEMTQFGILPRELSCPVPQ